MKSQTSKFKTALRDLQEALTFRQRARKEHIIYAGIAKCFEVALEYSWKYLKVEIESKGLEAFSPKDIIRMAGQSGIIDDVETWIEAINGRNIAVHDYLGITKDEYLDLIERFIPLAKKLLKK